MISARTSQPVNQISMRFPLRLPVLSIALVCLFAACRKDDDASSAVDVYAFGYIDTQAVYWKNGQVTPVGNGQFTAVGFAVSGNDDVYVAGYESKDTSSKAMIWKNGVFSGLEHGRSSAMADGVTIVGTDVYVAGTERTATGAWAAVYWKNGTRVPLESDPAGSRASSVAVVGNDVYVVGQRSFGIGSVMNVNACWKNGKLFYLADSNRNSLRCAITVSDGNIYTVSCEAGSRMNRLRSSYRKNFGAPVIIGDELADNLSGISIAAQGGSVSIAGWGEIQHSPGIFSAGARYWKDGTLIRLTDEKLEVQSSASSVAVDGRDVYVGGWSENNRKMVPTYWKNGVPVYPAATNVKGLIHHMFVRRK